MIKSEVAQLLTIIAAFDRRTLGDADVEAWHLIVGDLEPDDCAAAVKHHYATSRAWLMPADVRTFALAEARRREGARRIAAREAEIAAENQGELHSRPVAALEVGKPIPADAPVRVERRRMLRKAAHTKRAAIEADLKAAADHRARLAAARAELHPEVADA